MKVNYPVIIISAVITSIVVAMLLTTLGNPMGIPKDWNAGITGGFAAAVSSVLGQKFAKPNSSDENKESPQT